MKQIRRLTLEGFRGAPGAFYRLVPSEDWRSSICDSRGRQRNGKSTIVDAIELVLQGTYRRSKRLKSNALPSLLNLNGPTQTSAIEVLFDDNSIRRHFDPV